MKNGKSLVDAKEKVKEIMGFGDNFHICDVSEITEEYIHLESWNEDIKMDDFILITELIAKDGYDIEGFELLEIPHPKVFCFGNYNTNQYFDVVKFGDDEWQFAYLQSSQNGLQNVLAHSIREAVEKYEFD